MKRKKREEEAKIREAQEEEIKSKYGRSWTVSIALPASILDNAQSLELRTYLAGQVARAAVIFQVDEIILYDEFACPDPLDERRRCLSHFAKLLQYLECPQYLRRDFFPLQRDLQYAGLLNPLDCLHHLKSDDLHLPYREGIVMSKKTRENINSPLGSYVNVGLPSPAQVDRIITPGVRVTVSFDVNDLTAERLKNRRKFHAKVVSPSEPRTKYGYYWGYTVRIADSLSKVFTDCPFIVATTSDRCDEINEETDVQKDHENDEIEDEDNDNDDDEDEYHEHKREEDEEDEAQEAQDEDEKDGEEKYMKEDSCNHGFTGDDNEECNKCTRRKEDTQVEKKSKRNKKKKKKKSKKNKKKCKKDPDELPSDTGYDLLIGTSENGDEIDQVFPHIPGHFRHALIVFGGLKGIEAAMDSDPALSDVAQAKSLFNFYINTCPGQGSNTIRTEEALLISLATLRRKLMKFSPPAPTQSPSSASLVPSSPQSSS